MANVQDQITRELYQSNFDALKVVETTGLKHDGPIGESLEDKRFILVCDRAYFSIDKVDRYLKEQQHFVLRLKEMCN